MEHHCDSSDDDECDDDECDDDGCDDDGCDDDRCDDDGCDSYMILSHLSYMMNVMTMDVILT